MGNFYTNICLKNVTPEQALEALRKLRLDAFMHQAGQDIVVYERRSDQQDTEILAAIAERLSKDLNTIALAVLNHDDSILWFQLYDRSELISEYANRDGPRRNIGALVSALNPSASKLKVWYTLFRPYIFQVWRHEELARQLHLPWSSVGLGFNDLNDGDAPPGYFISEFIRV